MVMVGTISRGRRSGAPSINSPRPPLTRLRILHSQPSQETSSNPAPPSKLQSLQNLGHILYDPIRIPRHPIVLCHGLYGFTVRGPSSFPRFQIHYWGKLLEILRNKLGVKVIIGKVPPTGTIEERASHLNQLLQAESKSSHRDHPMFNLIAHSMGGLDARYLITHINPKDYSPISLTTICTPHRGSPFMDWCQANIGVGLSTSESNQKSIPFSLKEPLLRRTPEQLGYLPNNLLKVLLLNILDSPAYSNLSTDYLENQFNPSTPNHPNVKYFSVAAKISKDGLSVIHPLWLPGLLMDKLCGSEQGGHDGLVTVNSARWGDFLGVVEDTDHWEIRGRSAFGSNLNEPDGLLNQQAKSNWLELNRYVGSWLSSNNQNKIKKSSENLHLLPNTTLHQSSFHSNHHQIQDEQYLSTKALADWITKKLPINSYHSQNSSINNSSSDVKKITPIDSNCNKKLYCSTIHPAFPLDDLDFNLNQIHQKNEKNDFDLELFYLAICRNLHNHGL